MRRLNLGPTLCHVNQAEVNFSVEHYNLIVRFYVNFMSKNHFNFTFWYLIFEKTKSYRVRRIVSSFFLSLITDSTRITLLIAMLKPSEYFILIDFNNVFKFLTYSTINLYIIKATIADQLETKMFI